MDSQSQPPRNYLTAILRGLETQPEQAGLAQVQDPELRKFLSQLEKKTQFPTPEFLQKVSDKFDSDKSNLSDVELRILKLKAELQELKEERNDLREKVNSGGLLLETSESLTERKRLDSDSMRWLHDHLIGPNCRSVIDDMERTGYNDSIHIYMMILSKSTDQENKDHSCLQLALHALRIKDVQQADLIARLIVDPEIKCEYEFRKQIRRY